MLRLKNGQAGQVDALRNIWGFILSISDRMDKIHMGLISAGVAFYAMFAVFPGLAAIIALWGLWYDPTVIRGYVHVAEEFLPPEAMAILSAQVNALISGGRTCGLGVARLIRGCDDCGARGR